MASPAVKYKPPMHAFVVARPETITVSATSPDAFFLHPDTTIGIAEVRQIQHFLSRKPIASPQATVVIHKAHLLTVPAQNALLKTLEEPPAYARIYLVTDQPDSLLPTVLSRIQVVDTPKPRPVSPAQLNQTQKLLAKLLAAGVGERLKIIDVQAFTRDTALVFLDHLEQVIHQDLSLARLYPQVIEARTHLKANVNIKLALDHLALNLTSTTPSVPSYTGGETYGRK